MGRFVRTFVATLFLAGGLAVPQTQAQCADHPTTLAAMHGCYRVLLVAGSGAEDSALREQMQQLSADPDGLRERNLLIVPVGGAVQAAPSASGLPIAALEEAESRNVHERFRIHETFTVILIGKDGTEKLRSQRPLTLDRLFGTIDSMPMRRHEMRERQ